MERKNTNECLESSNFSHEEKSFKKPPRIELGVGRGQFHAGVNGLI